MKCLNCQKPTTNPKFCSKSCAAKYNNIGRVKSEKTKQKISLTIKTKISSGELLAKPPPNQKGKRWAKLKDNSWIEYREKAKFYTPYHLWEQIEGFELLQKFGWYHPINNPSGVTRDHLYSRRSGWLNNIPLEIIKHPANCRFVTDIENKRKGIKNNITIEELYQRIEIWGSREDLNSQPSDS